MISVTRKTCMAVTILVLGLAASWAGSDVPHDMNYQGRLTDAVGAPLSGPVNLELRIYDVLSAGSPLYAETHPAVALDDNGGFGVLFGTGTVSVGTFDASLFSGMNRYLEVVVDADVLTPRQPLSSVPWALVAEEAQSVAGNATLVTDVASLETQLGSAAPGDLPVVDQLSGQAGSIATNTAAAAAAQAAASGASTAADAAQVAAAAAQAAITQLESTLPSLQDFSGQDLTGQDLSGQNLSFFNLAGANLTGANLSGANLYRADLTGANLEGADLRSANLNSATLLDATLWNAKIGDSGSGPTRMLNANVAMTNLEPPALHGNSIGFSNSECSNPAAAGDCLVADGAVFTNRFIESGAWKGVRALGAIFRGAPAFVCGDMSDFSGSDFSAATYFRSQGPTCIARGSKFVGSGVGPVDDGDLAGSDFTGATLIHTLGGIFSSSSFSAAQFGVPGSSAPVIASLSGDFSNSDFSSANFLYANLHGTTGGSNFAGATFGNYFAIGGEASGSNFSGANLAGANLTGNHSGSDFSGANLGGALLGGTSADLILDGADLRGADLSGSRVWASLVGANLTAVQTACSWAECPHSTRWSPDADLSNANLDGVDFSSLSYPYIPGSLQGADLSGATLGSFADQQGIDLSVVSGNPLYLLGANLPKNLAYTNLSGHDLSGMDLSGADLREANLAGADLSGASLTGARLGNINLTGANLANTIFVDADLTDAALTGAYVDGSDFSGATLAGTTLTGLLNSTATPTTFANATLSGATLNGNLVGANLSGANLAGTDVSTATLTGANFTRAKLSTAIGLAAADATGADFTEADLAGVDVSGFSSPITCPDGTTSSSHSSQDCVGHLLANSFAGLEQSIQAPIGANTTAIDAEETRALAAEGVNAIAISGNDSDIASNAAAVVTERDRALASEGANNSAIASNDIDIAANAAAIATELDRALAAEETNNSAITSEAAARSAADVVHDTAIAAETSRAMIAEDSNALEINDLISELALDVVQVGDPRLSFTGTWTSQADTWGANRFSSGSRYSSCEGDMDCSAHTITLALDNNTWRTVLVSTLDWHRDHYFDVFISFDGGSNYTFHNRIETYRPSYTDPYVSSIRTLVSNLPQGQDVRVRMQATRGRIHFEGFALSHAVLSEDIQNRIAVRSEDGTISGDYVLEGNITVGTASTGSLEIAHDVDVSTTGGSGSLSIGDPAGPNIGIDGNEIMARNGSGGSTLFINANGGDVSIGNNPSGPSSNLDLSGNADIAGAALIGWERVSAVGSTTVASTCSFGGSTFSCRRGTATVSCSAGKVVLGGGCSCETQAFASGYDQTCRGFPVSDSSYRCHSYSPNSGAAFTAYATCARMGN